MVKHSIYKNCIIYKTKSVYRYCAYVNNGFVHSDTLQGIKRLINQGGKYA